MRRLSSLATRLLLLAITLTGMPPNGLTGLEAPRLHPRRKPRFRLRFAHP